MVVDVDELEKVLAQADAVAKKLKVSRRDALLIMIAHEVLCIHFHLDQILVRPVKPGVQHGPE